MTRITTDGQPKRYALFDGDDLITSGELCSTDHLATSLDVIADEDENAFIGALPAGAFLALPDSGWLEAGDIYSYSGIAVMVRQSHWRTEHDPADVPALFVVYREDAGSVLDWVAGESVIVGTRRMYDGTEYECLQAHVTQADWAPPSVPALWAEVEEEPQGPEPWVQPTGAHDAYALGAQVTHNGYVWTSLYAANVWEPGVFGWEQGDPV